MHSTPRAGGFPAGPLFQHSLPGPPHPRSWHPAPTSFLAQCAHLTVLPCGCPICELSRPLRVEEGSDFGRPGGLVQDFGFLGRWFSLQGRHVQLG